MNPSLPQLTLRAVVTGIVLGALLTPCNIYSGLKIGWSFNMSITAALLSLAFWGLLARCGARIWGLRENCINQTTASSAASIISGGLVAPIPAYTLITGNTLGLGALSLWVFSVSALGILVAFALRDQLLIRERAVFPAGVATAVTLRDIYAQGKEATQRVVALASAALCAASLKWTDTYLWRLPRLNPTAVAAQGGALQGTGGVTYANLTFGLEPSLLLLAFGGIIGLRAGLSLVAGAVLAWGLLGPLALQRGWALPGTPEASASWFGELVEWLLWPGVAVMVSASLTAFLLAVLLPRRSETDLEAAEEALLPGAELKRLPQVWRQRWWWLALVGLSALLTLLQVSFFGIDVWVALLAIPVAFVLAIVAARVVADTGIPPIGALGKVSQVSFAVVAPGDVTANLMTANVAGGTAGQTADLFNDLKTGLLVGVSPYAQGIAQFFGILTGAVVGSWVYLILIPDPQTMLLTETWAAPAVATWKAVAETLSTGLGSINTPARIAVLAGGLLGILIELGHRFAPGAVRRCLPSAAALGLAFVIPASFSFVMGFGALLAALFALSSKQWAGRLTLAIAAGLLAGESLAGVVSAVIDFLRA